MAKRTDAKQPLDTATVSNVIRGLVEKKVEQWKAEAGGSDLLASQLETLRGQLESSETPPSAKASIGDAVRSLEQAQREAIKPTLTTIAKGVAHALNGLGVPVAVKSDSPSTGGTASPRRRASGVLPLRDAVLEAVKGNEDRKEKAADLAARINEETGYAVTSINQEFGKLYKAEEIKKHPESGNRNRIYILAK